MELLDELLHLANEFDQHGVEYALCGGLARSIHGDVELPIQRELEFLVPLPMRLRARAAAAAAGFDIECGSACRDEGGISSHIRLLKLHDSDHLILDLILIEQPQIQPWLTRVQTYLAGRKIVLSSLEFANQSVAFRGRWLDRDDSLISSANALRLSRGESADQSAEAIDRRMSKVAELYRFWTATREARISAGIPGPNDLPLTETRPTFK